ncbi:MAG TPA: NAD(P)/FAD-dependent oxidoreductase [Candidatus Binataceae bacterium]|jgi:flavin-dependent dehydrogenase|nr:NAD(P)/FAD-dependent oxidoreductase [Candidatus Binataceae bacterium]
MYDAIVVGARCAGAPTAMLLARRGYRVLLVDRATFPSDIMSTHYIHQPGVARLARWGLLDAVLATNCPPIERVMLDAAEVRLEGAPAPFDGTHIALCPRRIGLDKILVDAAARAGAEVRQGFVVSDLTSDGDRVSGIRGRDLRGGAEAVERTRIVVGADGPWSMVARTVKASEYEAVEALTCGYYAYFSGVPMEACEVYPRQGCEILGFPTNDAMVCVAVERPRAVFARWRADIEGGFFKALAAAPELYERVRAGRREERFVGTAGIPNYLRRPYGSGWALVGDAGCHKDPITGYGITDAFRDAELLADAIDAGLAGREPMEQALARYESARNAAVLDLYRFTCAQARLEGPSEMLLALMRALAGNSEDTGRFMGAMATSVAQAEFYAPANLLRIMRAGGRA